jgi:hypothetical protein
MPAGLAWTGAVTVGVRALRRAVVVAVTCAGFLAPVGAGGVAWAASQPVPVGQAWQHPADPVSSGDYAHFGPGSGDEQDGAEAAALARAKATGAAVVVGSLTTPTSMVTAEPDGHLVAASSAAPVRVRTRAGWTPVDTRLRLSGGRLAPRAVPGDSVSFSAGGSSPAAEVSAGASSLGLSWPGRLPAPMVSGSSATYRNVLPGVNLVLTATSGQAGGFREVLVVTSRLAARDPGLASLAWRVSGAGTSGLRPLKDGGLAAVMGDGRGWFGSAPSVMWDSSSVMAGAPRPVVGAALASARSAGASLAGDGAGATSTAAGPAHGARVGAVAVRVARGGQSLSLVPDAALLASPATRFPVYVDPGFSYYDKTGAEQAFDPVQSECGGSNYDSAIDGLSPVGYDNWGGECSVGDTDYSLYRVAIPAGSLASNAVILSASFQVTEAYTSDCTSNVTMTATWINGISKTTGWPGPGAAAGNVDATTTLGPDTGSCASVEDTGSTVPAGFNVLPDLNTITDAATSITFRVWENGNTNEDDHKQLTTNPTLEVIWTTVPDTPTSLEESATSDPTQTVACATSASNAPVVGSTDAISGLNLVGTYGDPDGATVNVNIQYKVSTASSWTEQKNAIADVAEGKQESWPLPTSVTSGLADGTVMEWQAQAVSGSASVKGTTYGPYSSGWSSPCYFAVYPTVPDAPALTPDFTATTAQAVGSTISFTITQSDSSGKTPNPDPATEFVFGLDANPQTSGTIPAGRMCSTSTAEPYCTKITNGSATLTLTVPGPGPHDVTVYEKDTAGVDSGNNSGFPPGGQSNTYDGAGDTAVTYNAGASLQQNFTAAIADTTHPFGNTMISKAAGVTGGASADGTTSLDEKQLQDAGWTPGGTVTVDGATFPLPQFGTASSGPDNLLSANEVLGAGNAQGSALVFLAVASHGDVSVSSAAGSIGTGSPITDPTLRNDVTAPVTPAGSLVVGQQCSLGSFDGDTPCEAASGVITYAAGCASTTFQSYDLTVPDWVKGPSDIAALEMPNRDTSTGQLAQDNPKVYAFAVPLDPSCKVSTVALPDVGYVVNQPALHIFGMAFRNTTTATPEAGGTMAASLAGQGWTGAYASSIENAYGPPSGKAWGSQTVRMAVSPGVTAAAGAQVRIRLSNPGYWSEDGLKALTIGAASIAPQSSGPAASAGPTPLTFSNQTSHSAILPEGGDIYSDPVTLPFAVTPGQGILVSLYLLNSSVPVLPLNDDPSGAMSWFASSSTPNQTANQDGSPFTSGYSTTTVPLLTGLDVTTPAETDVTPALPGWPTVVVAGDGGIIDGPDNTSSLHPLPSDAGNDPSQRLAGQLAVLQQQQVVTNGGPSDATDFGIVDASVEDNMLLQDAPSSAAPGGLALEFRLDHDVLAEPDLGTVVINIGLQDVLAGDGSAATVTGALNALSDIATQLGAFHVQGNGVVIGSLTPCSGYSNTTSGYTCDSSADSGRLSVNSDISTLFGLCEAPFDGAVATGSGPETLATGYGDGDGANLSLGASGGYSALASMETSTCGFTAPAPVFPPTT